MDDDAPVPPDLVRSVIAQNERFVVGTLRPALAEAQRMQQQLETQLNDMYGAVAQVPTRRWTRSQHAAVLTRGGAAQPKAAASADGTPQQCPPTHATAHQAGLGGRRPGRRRGVRPMAPTSAVSRGRLPVRRGTG